MESYDLECSHERINVVPEPSEEIDFTDFLVCAEAEATQCLSSNYLKLLGEKRGKSPVEYFERFYILYHTLSNNRSKYKTERIPMFIWQACDDNAYDSTCWRFELIMSGWAAGTKKILFFF